MYEGHYHKYNLVKKIKYFEDGLVETINPKSKKVANILNLDDDMQVVDD